MSSLKPIPADIRLRELQDYVRHMYIERGFTGQTIDREFMGLVEEVGELAEVIKNVTRPNRNKGKTYDIGAEIADVMLYIICIANRMDVDIASEIEKKEAINRQRAWV